MRPASVPGYQLVFAMLLGTLLLFGRTALALHAYDHDVLASEPDCELCEHVLVSDESNRPGADPQPAIPTADLSETGFAAPEFTSRRRLHLPRAPPPLLV